jgi:hypothetical protein
MFNSGFRGKRAGDNQGTVNLQTSFVQNLYPQPTITGWSITGTDDTALDPAGGQTVLVNGTGFASGVAATVSGSTISPVTLVNPTQISFTSPALAGGSYSLIVYNSTGGAAILVPGLVYSSVPTYTTAAGSIGNIYETNSISTQVIATSDSAITYSLASGSLPSGATLYANGVITGTAPVDSASTTYTFGVTATDAELQDVTRTFTLTINTDNVTWSNPSSNTSINLDGTAYSNTLSATSAAGKSITYTANSLPTGLTLSTATISGTPTIAGTTTTLLTATAATTNRTNQRTITWIVEINDPYFKYVTLLLTGETTVMPFINDASANSFALTINGDTKPVLFNPYTPGYYSNYFDGTGDWLTFPNNSAFAFGTSAFTIEFWIYAPSVLNDKFFISGRGAIGTMHITSGGYDSTTAGSLRYVGSSTITSGSTLVTDGSWHHCAIVRDGSNNITLYVDGVSRGTGTDSTNYTTTAGTWHLNANDSGPTAGGAAYYSNFRIVKGTAVYNSTFTPSTTPLTAIANTSLLTCQSNRLIDNSTNNFAITKNGDVSVSPAIPFTQNSSYSTYGSTYFDGTGDTLTIPSPTTGFSLGTGEFTIEMWVYKTSAVNSVLLDARSSAAGLPWVVAIDGTNFPYWYDNTVYSSTVAVTLNSWTHIAVVKTSGVLKIFVNGVQGYSASYSVNLDRTAGLVIGDTVHAAGPMLGYISNLRIVKGTAVYTTAFTPPTTPLTAIANTQLLTLQYNGGATNQAIIDNSNFNNIITRFGNTSQGSFSPYSVTGWSNYFDGTGDYLTVADNAVFEMTGDFTVEAWFYCAALPGSGAFGDIITKGAAGVFQPYYIFIRDSGALVFYSSSDGSSWNVAQNVSFGTIAINTWYHVAVSRSGSSLRMFLNGALINTITNSNALTNNVRAVAIGARSDGTELFIGYISNVRIVKGTAVYTSAFTPSTTPLTTITNTSLLTCQSNRLIDNSPNNFTITRTGDVSVQAFGPFGSIPEAVPISYSNYFDGTTDFITAVGSGAVVRSSGSFTIEGWYYPTSSAAVFRAVYSSGTGYATAGRLYQNNTTLTFYWSGSGGITGSIGWTLNTWQHFAVTWNGTTTKVYVNGQESISSTSPTYSGTVDLSIGESTYSPFGYISNFRIVNSVVYTSAFTPSTTPLTAIANTSLLTCQSTTMIDNSTNRFTLTANGNVTPIIFNPFGYTAQSAISYTPSLHGGSAYFDGTGDYLRYNNTSIMSFSGTSNFTVECWIYQTAYTSTSGYMNTIIGDLTPTDATALYWCIGMNASNQPGIRWYDGTLKTADSGTALLLNIWNHVAWVVTSGVVTIYINGVKATLSGTTTLTTPSSALGYYITGADRGTYVTGYMSDLRIIKSAIYTSSFIPPAQTIGNYSTSYPSQLLLNFNNGGIIDQHGSNVLETVGNTQLSTSVKKYNNSSIYFDGTGDYLKVPSSVAFAFGTGDFTWEAWVYFNSTGGRIIDFNTGILWLTSGTLQYYSGSGRITSGALTLGQWYHVALVRGSGVTKMYINGTQNGVNFTDSINYPTNALIIGSDSGSLTQFMSGYIDDLRITKGYARYTSNFTAPTSAFIGK